jgi:hypothetical protein
MEINPQNLKIMKREIKSYENKLKNMGLVQTNFSDLMEKAG